MIKYNSDFHAYTDSTLLPNNQFAFILFLSSLCVRFDLY